MIRVAGLSIALVATAGLFAQNQSGFVNSGGIVRGFSSVVHPAGTSAMPGIQRFTGSVVYPGGGGPQIGIPGLRLNQSIGGRPGGPHGGAYRNSGFIYTVPVYVGSGLYDSSYIAPPAQPPAQQQPNVTVIYPPPAAPVVIYPQDSGQGMAAQYPPATEPSLYQPAMRAEGADDSKPTNYLIAFKDHTIYSAVAYWVDGDTLHYFTAGNTHNQVSVSLVDRALTERLNQGTGLEVKLPK